MKSPLPCNVHEAAVARIEYLFGEFEQVYVSFSGGKDSTVMLHLIMEVARHRGRTVGLLFVDLEAQYALTIEHVLAMYERYADHIEPYWIALPLRLRNAVSQFEPRWMCWEPGRESDWVRRPPDIAITDPEFFEFFSPGMEFEDFVVQFGHWFGAGKPTTCAVGIRTDESLNRWRTIASTRKTSYEERQWTTRIAGSLYNAYPIYDWQTRDIWIYHGKTGLPYNELYDRMHKAGLSIHDARICQPYGDDQRRGLWLYHIIEPETWGRVVARVNGANGGALYARESGNILGVGKIALPDGHTWESFARLLLDTMPKALAEHYRNKIAVFLKWWKDRGYAKGIPDEAPPRLESAAAGSDRKPSWRRICKALLRNDYWCKGLSFSQTKPEAYERYKALTAERRKQWDVSI